MIKRKIKFVWGSSDAIKGEWRLGLVGEYVRDTVSGAKGWAISVRGVLRWLAALALAAYLVGVSALYFWLDRKAYNTVTYTDTLLLPIRWDDIREKVGLAMIQEGLDDMKAQRWAEAHMKLRIGLARAPQDRRARIELAKFYLGTNQRDQAMKILMDGLAYGYPGRVYMDVLLPAALAGEDYQLVIEIADRFVDADTPGRHLLIARKLSALLGLEQNEEALRLAEQEDREGRSAIREARATALLNLGRHEEAIAYLQLWESESVTKPMPLRRLQARAFRELGRFSEMEEALRLLRVENPTDPNTLVFAVSQNFQAGRTQEAGGAMDEFMLRFGARGRNLMLLAGELEQIGAVKLLERCVEEAKAHGFVTREFLMALTAGKLRAGDWSEAARLASQLEPDPKRSRPVELFVIDYLKRLSAATTTTDAGVQSGVVAMFQGRHLPIKSYREATETLLRAGRLDTAKQVLDFGLRNYPNSMRLAKLQSEITTLVAEREATKVREEPKAAPRGPGEAEFFQRIDTQVAAGEWSAILRGVREIRVAKPDWLADREGDLLDLQIRASARTGDAVEMVGTVRQFLNGSRQRADRVLALASELRPEDSANADRLLQEVLRRTPDYPPALRLQRAWRPEAESGSN